MASNFIPMLSSSPPPLDDCPDNDDDDEEFGNFTTAGVQFDSSFDSPVSGEKYKPFKTGENGVNDIGMKNDLNSFCSYSNSPLPPAKDLVLSLSPHNQSNHKNSSPNESDNEDELILDSCGKLAFSKRQDSSKEKLSTNNDNSVTSQNCVAESLHTVHNAVENCHDSCKEDVWVRQDGFNCSNEVDFSHTEPNCNQSKLSDCDELKSSSFEEELEATKDSESVHIPIGDISNSFQSTDDELLSNQDPSAVNFVESKSKETDPKMDNQDVAVSVTEHSEHFVADFPVDFPDSTSLDEFDDFQDANTSNTNLENGNTLNDHDVSNQESREFVARFDDVPSEKEVSSNGGFVAFQANESAPLSDAEEFDDFQGFDKTSHCEPSVNGEDDMCDFKGVPELESEDFDDFQGCSNEQDFANFECEPFNDKVRSGSPEFADFEQASFSSMSSETIPSSSFLPSSAAAAAQDKSVDKISTVINAIFPPLEEPSDVDASYDPSLEVLEQSNKSRRLWEKLHEVEQTPGLRFQWGVSHTFQQLLRSVNVDYHSILRTSSVPIFASGLSLLEPVKGQTNSANPESEDRNQSPRDPIPPVEFDWNTSGLINPLDSVQSISTLMDLSFLSTSDSGTSSVTKDHSFENEFLKPSPVPACSENSNKTFILEELLSKNVCSIPNSNVTHRPTDLSEEANCVLDQLPDLSYMRAKVLMFPISSKT